MRRPIRATGPCGGHGVNHGVAGDSISWLYRFVYRWYPGEPQDIRSAARAVARALRSPALAASDGARPRIRRLPGGLRSHAGRVRGAVRDVCANACGSTHWTELLAVPCDVLRRAVSACWSAPPADRLVGQAPSDPVGRTRPPGCATWPTAERARGCVRASAGIAVIAAPRQQHAEIVGRHEVLGVHQDRGLEEDHRLRLGRRQGTALLVGHRVVQFAQGVQGHRPGHFVSRRRGKLFLGKREIALQRRHRGQVGGFALQHRRCVGGDDAGQVGVGLQPRAVGQKIVGLFHRGQCGGQRPAVNVGFLLAVQSFGDQLQRAEKLQPRGEVGPSARQLEAVPGLPVGLSGNLLQLLGTLAARPRRSSAATPSPAAPASEGQR